METDPPGATVRLSNGVTGTTPVRFGVPRHASLELTISKAGYVPVRLQVPVVIDAVGALNVATPFVTFPSPGGLFLGLTELAAPAARAHRPNPVRVKLQPQPAPAAGST